MGGYDAYTTDDDGDGDDGGVGVGVGIDGDFEGAHNTAHHSGGNGDNWRGGLSGAGRLSHGNSDDSDIAAADGWTLIEKPEEGPAGGPATISTTEVPMPEGAGTPTTASTPAPAAVYPTIKLAPQHTWYALSHRNLVKSRGLWSLGATATPPRTVTMVRVRPINVLSWELAARPRAPLDES